MERAQKFVRQPPYRATGAIIGAGMLSFSRLALLHNISHRHLLGRPYAVCLFVTVGHAMQVLRPAQWRGIADHCGSVLITTTDPELPLSQAVTMPAGRNRQAEYSTL